MTLSGLILEILVKLKESVCICISLRKARDKGKVKQVTLVTSHQEQQFQDGHPLHGSQMLEMPRKLWLTQAPDGTVLYSHRTRQNIGHPRPVGLIPQPQQEDGLHILFLYCRWRIMFPPFQEQIEQWVDRFHMMHTLKQNKEREAYNRGRYSQRWYAQHRVWGLPISLEGNVPLCSPHSR